MVGWDRCSKSRACHALLTERVEEFEAIHYLENPPSKKDIKELLVKLGMTADQLLRKTEPIFKEVYSGKKMTENQCINAMVKYPKLMERPIVVKGDKAAIGRPLENVIALLEE